MKRAVTILLAVALVGCTESIVLPVDQTLAHDEIVERLKTLFKDEVVLADDAPFFIGGSEERISPAKTRLMYRHLMTQPAPSLYTPNVSYDWTFIDIDSSQEGEVRISAKTYRHGNFINSRQREAESRIIKSLSILKERANKSLQPTAKRGG